MMKIGMRFCLALLLMVALQANRQGADRFYLGDAQGKPRLFVAPVTSRVFNAESRDFVGMLLLQEVSRFGDYDVLSFAEINAVLGVEKVKDQLGCSDVVCLSEIGMALGGADILQAEVKKVKRQTFLKLSIVKPLEVRTSHRALEMLSGNLQKWPQGVRQAVTQLLEPTQSRQDNIAPGGFMAEPKSLKELGLGDGTTIHVVANAPCTIEHNGTTSTQNIQPRTARGVIRLSCSGTPSAFEKVKLSYNIDARGITYEINSEPWAIVRDKDAIGLGRTPLAPQHSKNTAFFQLINPKARRQLLISLRFVRG